MPDDITADQLEWYEKYMDREFTKREKLIEGLSEQDREMLKEKHEESESIQPFVVWLRTLTLEEILNIIF